MKALKKLFSLFFVLLLSIQFAVSQPFFTNNKSGDNTLNDKGWVYFEFRGENGYGFSEEHSTWYYQYEDDADTTGLYDNQTIMVNFTHKYDNGDISYVKELLYSPTPMDIKSVDLTFELNGTINYIDSVHLEDLFDSFEMCFFMADGSYYLLYIDELQYFNKWNIYDNINLKNVVAIYFAYLNNNLIDYNSQHYMHFYKIGINGTKGHLYNDNDTLAIYNNGYNKAFTMNIDSILSLNNKITQLTDSVSLLNNNLTILSDSVLLLNQTLIDTIRFYNENSVLLTDTIDIYNNGYSDGYSQGLADCDGNSTKFNTNDNNVNVYPNPISNNSTLYIDSDNMVFVEIYSMTGTLLLSTNEKEITITDLKQGVYLIRVYDNNGNYSTKRISIQ